MINYNFLKRPNSQSMSQFQENGAIYITKPKTYEKNKNRLGGKISFYEMSFSFRLVISCTKMLINSPISYLEQLK